MSSTFDSISEPSVPISIPTEPRRACCFDGRVCPVVDTWLVVDEIRKGQAELVRLEVGLPLDNTEALVELELHVALYFAVVVGGEAVCDGFVHALAHDGQLSNLDRFGVSLSTMPSSMAKSKS